MSHVCSYIRLFDFDTTHIPGNKNGAADALSRRGQSIEDDEESEKDTDEYFEARMYGIAVAGDPKPLMARVYFHEGEYMGDDLTLGQYLETLQRPNRLTDAEYRQLRRKARGFFVRDGYLFKRGRKRGFPPRRVVGTQDQRSEIIRELHDEIGHAERRRRMVMYLVDINGKACMRTSKNGSGPARDANAVHEIDMKSHYILRGV
jgi:hypothetical protein